MEEEELDKWWAHLTVETKEAVSHIEYPRCSSWWNTLSIEGKENLYNVSGGRDAHDHHKWRKGNTSFT